MNAFRMKVTRVHDEIIVEGGTEQGHQTLLEQERERLIAEGERFALYFQGASIKSVPALSEQQARPLVEEWQRLWRIE